MCCHKGMWIVFPVAVYTSPPFSSLLYTLPPVTTGHCLMRSLKLWLTKWTLEMWVEPMELQLSSTKTCNCTTAWTHLLLPEVLIVWPPDEQWMPSHNWWLLLFTDTCSFTLVLLLTLEAYGNYSVFQSSAKNTVL